MAEYAECNSRRNKDQCKRGHGPGGTCERISETGRPSYFACLYGREA